MHFKSIIAAALLSAVTVVNADFVIATSTWSYSIPTSITKASDRSKWLSSVSSKADKAVSTYTTHLTGEKQYSSIQSLAGEYFATRSDVPSEVTATDQTTTYTTLPAWFTAMPKDLKSYYQSVIAAEVSLESKVYNGNAPAPRPTGPMAYMGAAAAAAGAFGIGVLAL